MTSRLHDLEPGRRIVVVSPHLDDGVLSLGAAMASWARADSRVELLTVFGCDPDSGAQAGGWDRRGGFSSEGESARARREEDRRACVILGISPVWLPFGSVDYERHGYEETVLEAIVSRIAGADLVLLPGFPLSHPDHAWLMEVLAKGGIPGGRIGLYAEQPYAARTTSEPSAPEWLKVGTGVRSSFEPSVASVRDRVSKWRAIRAYRSQLPLLALTGVRRGAHVLAWERELVASASPRAK
jgi:LmbE family N-acetylglucosaminyl deacetylase